MNCMLVALVAGHISLTAGGGPAINDPISGITPVRGPYWSGRKERPDTGAATSKRDANIIHASPLRGERSRAGEQDSIDEGGSDTGHCTYSFVVPRTHQRCRGLSSPSQESEKHVINLHREVLNAKTQIDRVRMEMEEEKKTFPSAREIGELRENVELLQQESRNTESRVSQLYMQLLHEIINKRDTSIEMQQLEVKLLNQTVRYHALKEDHGRLIQDHNALRLLIENQSEELERVRRQIRQLASRGARPATQQTRHTARSTAARAAPTTTSASVASPNTEVTETRKRSSDYQAVTSHTGPLFSDCVQVQRSGHRRSGIFKLQLREYNKKIRVWCDFEQDPGGWIVIQRRTGRGVNFNRNFAAYKRGFGKLRSDYWLGLEKIHRLTNQTGINFKLHIDMEDWGGKKTFVEYQSFRVGGEETGYRLNINHYSGTAGDSLTWHNNMRFTTSDNDQDLFNFNCARVHHGGWWYNTCAHSNLNGLYYRGGHYRSRYQDGIYWSEWRGGSYSLRSVSMKIRSTE